MCISRGTISVNHGTKATNARPIASTNRYGSMWRVADSIVVSQMEQVTYIPTPMGGENAPTPMAMIITIPYCSASIPNEGVTGRRSGPKISSAGKPSSSAPISTSVTIVPSMKSHEDPCSTPSNDAICCGILASVSDHEKVLAVLVMNSTMPALAEVSTMTRQKPSSESAL